MEELIIRVLQHQSTPEEERQLVLWRAQDPANESRYRQLLEIWDLTAAADPARTAHPHPDAFDLIQIAQARTLAETAPRALPFAGHGPKDHPRRWGTSSRVLRLAGMAAAIVFVALGLRVLLELRASAGGTRRQVATGAMGVVTVTLADRSSIRLGPDSRLDVVENARATVAHLQGRAFFGVTANPARPFIVRTEYGDAVVHGTRFEVSTDRGAMRVLVVDGRVSLNAAGVSTPLIRGDVGLHQRGAPTRTYRLVNVDEELDWMGNALIFQRTPFLQAISEIEIRYGVKVQVDQPPASDLTITATFTDQPLDQIVQVVCETVRAKCSVVHS